jgi:hypothetical protein
MDMLLERGSGRLVIDSRKKTPAGQALKPAILS